MIIVKKSLTLSKHPFLDMHGDIYLSNYAIIDLYGCYSVVVTQATYNKIYLLCG